MNVLDLNLYALRYFVDSIELNSLTLAALKNHVTRPAISQAIKRIESVVGFRLIKHSKNRLELTEEGRIFFRKAKEGLKGFTASLAEGSASEALSIGCSASLAEHLILPALKKPPLKGVNLRLRIGTTAKVRQLVTDKEVQLGILVDDEKTFGLVSEVLKKGEFHIYSRSGRPDGNLITTESRPEVSHFFKCLKSAGKEFHQHYEFESWSVCRQASRILGGACVLPDFMAGPELKKVRGLSFSYPFQILAISLTKQRSEQEVQLMRALERHD